MNRYMLALAIGCLGLAGCQKERSSGGSGEAASKAGRFQYAAEVVCGADYIICVRVRELAAIPALQRWYGWFCNHPRGILTHALFSPQLEFSADRVETVVGSVRLGPEAFVLRAVLCGQFPNEWVDALKAVGQTATSTRLDITKSSPTSRPDRDPNDRPDTYPDEYPRAPLAPRPDWAYPPELDLLPDGVIVWAGSERAGFKMFLTSQARQRCRGMAASVSKPADDSMWVPFTVVLRFDRDRDAAEVLERSAKGPATVFRRQTRDVQIRQDGRFVILTGLVRGDDIPCSL